MPTRVLQHVKGEGEGLTTKLSDLLSGPHRAGLIRLNKIGALKEAVGGILEFWRFVCHPARKNILLLLSFEFLSF